MNTRRALKLPAFVLGLLGPTSVSATHRSFDDDYRRIAVVDEAARAAEAAGRSPCGRASSPESDNRAGSMPDSH